MTSNRSEHAPGRPRSWHGAIMAGGASKRFGRDKVFATIAGRRLIDLAMASLADAEGVEVLLGSPERVAATASALPAGAVGVADDVPGHGPLAGLATALRRRPRAWLAVLAADMPLVPRTWWQQLAEQHRGGTLAVVVRDASGRWEPLAALYHGSLAGRFQRALVGADGVALAFQPLLAELDAERLLTVVDAAAMPEGALANVNRPTDADAIERALAPNG